MATSYEKAVHPEDLARFFVERANAGDVEGLVLLYEADAVVAFPTGNIAQGHAAIRKVCAAFQASRPQFQPGAQHPPLCLGDLALTSRRLAGGGATAEVARRQADGSWRWVLDRPNVLA